MSNQNHFDEERISNVVLSFINAKTWAESKAIVQTHQDDLLTSAAIQVFEALLMQYKDDEKARRLLEDHRSLLLRCQSDGIDDAFAGRLQERSTPDIPPELLARLRSIRTDAELRELIREHPELLPVIRQIATQSQAPQGSSADVSDPDELPALLREVNSLNRPSDMPRRVELCQIALGLVNQSAQPELWAGLQGELGNSLAQNPLGHRAENIDRAIEHYKQALEVRTRAAFPEDWAATQNNLANAYSDRIRGERAENIDRAIEHYNQALEVRTREAFPENWAMTQNNLANAYNNRIRGERAENIDRAIEHYKQALEVRTRAAFPEDWATTQNNLANAYSTRIRGDRADNIYRAIDHYNQALEVRTRAAFPEDWAATQNNLATAHLDRIRGDRADNIDRAIEHYNQALEVRTRAAFPEQWATTQNNLANAYSTRIRGDRADNIDRTIEHYNQALEVRTIMRFPADRRQTLNNLGHLYFTEQSWGDALADYDGAIEAGNVVLAEAHTEVGRKAEVGETSRLYVRSAYCLLKLEQIEKAVLRLEEGKTRLLTEALALADADLDMLSETQKQAMSEARGAVHSLEAEMRLSSDAPGRRTDVELGDLLRRKRIDLNELVNNLRLEHPDFMPTGIDLPGVLRLIPEDGALVAPLVTSMGSAVIVIPHGADLVESDHVVMLDSLTEDDVLELLRGPANETGLGGWMGAYSDFCDEKRTTADMERWLDVIEATTGKLWITLMGPVHRKLQDLKLTEAAPVILMPQGYLGLLPLHASWREMNGERRAFVDDYTVTYAPSAYSLSISKGRMRDVSRQKPSLLAVINPTEDLRYTPVEGMAVESLFDPDDRQTLSGNVATKGTVVENIPGWAYLHFSCHGIYNWQNVMNSGLVLANHGILTLSEIISGLNLDTARLVTLSACETGMTDIRQSPDEFIGLPTGFLQAGAAGVVSTLWAVSDAATSLLIKHFYREHLKDGLPPDQALRSAQLWLRGATREELGETYKSIARMSHHEAYRELAMGGDLGDKPYANPYYWAAFTFTGK